MAIHIEANALKKRGDTVVSVSDSLDNGLPTPGNFMHQDEFDRYYGFIPPRKSPNKLLPWLRRSLRSCTSLQNFYQFLISFIPIVNWLPTYQWSRDAVGDMTAGITTGIINVPQGIAYAVLAGVAPVCGLYASFFPVICYVFFGTSRHVSVGPLAIISLMAGTSIMRIMDAIHAEHMYDEADYVEHAAEMGYSAVSINNLTADVPYHIHDVTKYQIVASLSLCIGLIHIFLAVLHVEFLAAYLSDQIISGFTTAAVIHVFVVQLSKLFQVKVDTFMSRFGEIFIHLHRTLCKTPEMNVVAFAASIAGLFLLFIGKDLVNVWLHRRNRLQLPVELILVCLATAVSHFLNFKENYDVRVVNSVPIGLPSATLPRLDLLPYVYKEAVVVAFVIAAMHLSLCKLFSSRHGYKTDNNQELCAFGILGILSSCFPAYPVSSSISRSLVSEENGCRSQLSGVVSSALVLVVILWLAPLLRSLPMSILAAIIIYSTKSVFRKCSELRKLWRMSKVDFAIFSVSFVATLLTDVMWGLIISVVFALLTTVFRIQWPRWHLLSRLEGSRHYRDCLRYSQTANCGNIRVFRFDAPLLFTNVEHFRRSVEKALTKSPPNRENFEVTRKQCDKENGVAQKPQVWKVVPHHVEHFIIDCSGFTFIDFSSVKALVELYEQLTGRRINVYFAGAKVPIRDVFETCGLYDSISSKRFFPTIHDAFQAACAKMSDEKITELTLDDKGLACSAVNGAAGNGSI